MRTASTYLHKEKSTTHMCTHTYSNAKRRKKVSNLLRKKGFLFSLSLKRKLKKEQKMKFQNL